MRLILFRLQIFLLSSPWEDDIGNKSRVSAITIIYCSTHSIAICWTQKNQQRNYPIWTIVQREFTPRPTMQMTPKLTFGASMKILRHLPKRLEFRWGFFWQIFWHSLWLLDILLRGALMLFFCGGFVSSCDRIVILLEDFWHTLSVVFWKNCGTYFSLSRNSWRLKFLSLPHCLAKDQGKSMNSIQESVKSDKNPSRTFRNIVIGYFLTYGGCYFLCS